METFDKYKQELDIDCKIDMLNLRDAQMRLPAVKHKWAARLINHKIEQAKIGRLIKEATATIIERQMADAKVKMSRPSLEKLASEHETIIRLKEKSNEAEYIIMYLEKVEQILRSVTYDIKNLTEIMKLEQL